MVDSDYNNDTKYKQTFYKDVINRLNVLGSAEQLNYYRNLFYKDGNSTIEGIIANAINEYVVNLVKQCSDLESRIKNVESIAFRYGQIDGDHHKMWTIDQMVRALTGTETDYKLWVQDYVYDTETGEEYTWDTGIAP